MRPQVRGKTRQRRGTPSRFNPNNGGPRPGGFPIPITDGAGGRGGPIPPITDGAGNRGGWQQRGFDSRDAAQSVQRQYGLVQDGAGGWEKPDMDFLQRQMTSQGWGPDQPVQNPVGIGGARWMVGGGAPQYTGQASDAQFGNMPVGQSYDSAQQTPYGLNRSPFGRIRRRGGTTGGYLS